MQTSYNTLSNPFDQRFLLQCVVLLYRRINDEEEGEIRNNYQIKPNQYISMRDRESQSSKYYGMMSPRAIDLYNNEEVYFISYLDCRNLFLQMLTILVIIHLMIIMISLKIMLLQKKIRLGMYFLYLFIFVEIAMYIMESLLLLVSLYHLLFIMILQLKVLVKITIQLLHLIILLMKVEIDVVV